MKIKYATLSQPGKKRCNQDAFQVLNIPQHNRLLALISDGMGGHAFGDVASKLVCSTFSEYWQQQITQPDSPQKVKEACGKVCQVIQQQSDQRFHAKMGATMVMASIQDNTVTIAHIGDSRCYLQRPSQGIIYHTNDHVLQVEGYEKISKCFFSYRPDVAKPETVQFTLQPGDRLLLCSDGVHKSIASEDLILRMMEPKSLDDILNDFNTLCQQYGYDNYTAILMEIATD